MKLKIGEIYRISKDCSLDNVELINNVKNFIFYTKINNRDSTFRFEKGIHNSKIIRTNEGNRCPIIIISSSPHKAGTDNTPWKDRYDSDNGVVIYYGDCKDNKNNPYETSGNKVLMDEWKKHSSNNVKERERATPIVFFERIKKGFLLFHGLGVLEKVSLITQKGNNNNEFTNLEFEFGLLDLSKENNQLDWDWIAKRCDNTLSNQETNKTAPESWKYWIKNGNDKIEKVRRHVLKSKIIKEKDQMPSKGTIEDKIIKLIEKHYEHKKLLFELFALQITQFYFIENNIKYLEGYITKGSGDKGIDFISRIDIGYELAGIKMVVIGQAKCQNNTISSKDIARTVAKLKRNYIGVFVTNSVFSSQTQEEILEDQYPLIMINGFKMAQSVNKYILDSSNDLSLLEDYLNQIDEQYDGYKSNIRPDDIIYK